MSSSEGFAFSASSEAAAISTPGMQNPHWATPWRTNASCTGVSAPPRASLVCCEMFTAFAGLATAATPDTLP